MSKSIYEVMEELGPGEAPARGHPGPGGSSSLECLGNTVGQGEEVVVRQYTQVCAERCKDWFCPNCSKVQGNHFRGKVINAWPELKNPMMLTFTLDPTIFPDGPEAAFRHVCERRAVSRTLHAVKRFHAGKWFAVVEWQENGWAH